MSYLIKTKYLGPTNTKGGRIRASSTLFNESVMIGVGDWAMLAAHTKAARLLVDKIDDRLKCRSSDPEYIEFDSKSGLVYFVAR